MGVARKTQGARQAPIYVDDRGRWCGDGFLAGELSGTSPIRPLPTVLRLRAHDPGQLQRLLHARAGARLEGLGQCATWRSRSRPRQVRLPVPAGANTEIGPAAGIRSEGARRRAGHIWPDAATAPGVRATPADLDTSAQPAGTETCG